MTEHSKIPLPSGKSLLERSQAGDDKGFKPAPVPADLIAKAGKRMARATIKVPVVKPAMDAEVEEASPTHAEESTAPAARAPEPDPVSFSGPIQTVDRAGLADLGMIVPEAPVSGLLEEFRIVKRQVLQSARQGQASNDLKTRERAQRVLVCSPHTGEGKTFCAVNLALAMAAERECEVVLVDADVAKPSVLSTLGLATGPGFLDAIVDPQSKVEDFVIRTDIPGLFVLPAGKQTDADSEYIASDATAKVLARLTQGASKRIILFDSPPALAASPAADLARHAGQALLVARADRTGQSALEDAVQLLSNCQDIKLLLNAAHFSPSGRRFGSYYGYGG